MKTILIISALLSCGAITLEASQPAAIETRVKKLENNQKTARAIVCEKQKNIIPLLYRPLLQDTGMVHECLAAIIDLDAPRMLKYMTHLPLGKSHDFVWNFFFKTLSDRNFSKQQLNTFESDAFCILYGSTIKTARPHYIPQHDFSELLKYIGRKTFKMFRGMKNPNTEYDMCQCILLLDTQGWIHNWILSHKSSWTPFTVICRQSADQLLSQMCLERMDDLRSNGRTTSAAEVQWDASV